MTIKTRDELNADFADGAIRGTASELTAAKIRDFIESLGVGGTMYASDVPLPVTGSWVPVATFTDSIDTHGITEDLVTGEFVIGAGADGVYGVSVAMGVFYPAGPSGWVEFAITKNGVLTPYRAKTTLAAGEDVILSIVGSGNLAEDDRLGLKVRASGATTLTLTNGQLRTIRG